MVLPRRLARFNRVATNRVLGRLVGRVPLFAMVVHAGRRTGTNYETPVWAFPTDAGYAIALTYGSECDWVRNVIAAGDCRLRLRSGEVEAHAPEVVVGEAGLALLPAPVRPVLRVLGALEVLQLQR